MAKKRKSLSNKIKKTILDTADSVKDAVDNIDLPDVKVPQNVQRAATTINKGVKKTAKNVAGNIQDAAKTVKTKAEEIDLPDLKVPENIRDFFDRDDEEVVFPLEIEGAKVLSTESALRIIYYLMVVDGQITQEEQEKFDLVGRELDLNFKDHRDTIVESCQTQIENTEENDYLGKIKTCVNKTVSESVPTKDSYITPKLLIWDLLAIAYSDENYGKEEKKLIYYMIRLLNVNKADYLEMESSFLTLIDIQRESDWIKTTNRQYKEIEAVVNELADRHDVVFESVNDLITL